jgi:hypothetical protein
VASAAQPDTETTSLGNWMTGTPTRRQEPACRARIVTLPKRLAWLRCAAVCAAALAFWLPAARAQGTLVVAAHAEPAPAELAEPVRAAVAPGGLQASVGGATLQFWWVHAVERGSSGVPDSPWAQVAEGTLVGALRVSAAPLRDIRGRVIKPGVYTLRYAVQPANGDHMGVSPYREFLLVAPAASDTGVAGVGHEKAVDLARQTIGSSHPAVLSIDPPRASEAPLAIHTNAAGHQAVIVEVPVAGGGSLRFGLVLVGKIEA